MVTLALVGSLLWLSLSAPQAKRTPFTLAIGPQLGSQHGLGADAAQGGPGAYLEAVEAISGLKLKLVRAESIERAVLMLHEQQVDGLAFSLPTTAALLPDNASISPSFYSGSSVLVTRRTAAFRALSAMDGMRVGVIGSGEYRAFLAAQFPAIEIHPMHAVDEMLDAVDSGGVDAALGVDAVLAPLTRKRFGDRLDVHVAHDAPAVEMRVASLPRRAGEIAMAHQAFRSLPLDTRQDILDRWLTAMYRSPPTLRAVLSHYRLPITLMGVALLAFLLAVAQANRNARALATRQASAARILTLVNHEVRNGAAAVLSAIDLLEADTDTLRRMEHFQSARAAADALRHTLTNALEFMLREKPVPGDDALLQPALRVVEECISGMRPLAGCKGLQITLEAGAGPINAAVCDARALHHIASNLISNAIKFSEHGGIGIGLGFIPGVGDAGRLVLSVTDAGPGIPEEDIERIFEPFSTTRIGRLKHGAGLGLSLCRTIAQANGGDVTVFSEPGNGATFVATLRGQAGMPVPTRPSVSVQPGLSLANALVIEDQPAVANVMVHRLRSLGFDVVLASSGAAAIKRMKHRGPFGIVTLDGDLMDADGGDIALELRAIERRQDWPQARLLSVSASCEVMDRTPYERAGVHAYLVKPIDWAAFDAACGRPAAKAPVVPITPARDQLSVMEIYEHQMRLDLAGLEVSIRVQNWRGALAMAHRMQGAASMVGDSRALATLCELQQRFKAHAINGDPADDSLWAMVATLAPGPTDGHKAAG